MFSAELLKNISQNYNFHPNFYTKVELRKSAYKLTVPRQMWKFVFDWNIKRAQNKYPTEIFPTLTKQIKIIYSQNIQRSTHFGHKTQVCILCNAKEHVRVSPPTPGLRRLGRTEICPITPPEGLVMNTPATELGDNTTDAKMYRVTGEIYWPNGLYHRG